MAGRERLEKIRQIIKSQKKITVSKLSEQCNVTEETI